MAVYFAPMEGVTGYIFRNTHHKFYKGVDKYFAPFLVATQSGKMKNREMRDVLKEHNEGVHMIPQILANRSEAFLSAAGQLAAMGYQEINLNLGCPSRTVVSKGRGSGFLQDTYQLNQFFSDIFDTDISYRISVKTRIGKADWEDWEEILEIFNRYPIHELIIHPRLQIDYYKNKPRMEAFNKALEVSRIPVCYNGDLFTEKCCQEFQEKYPQVHHIMLGRGLLRNPWMMDPSADKTQELRRLKEFLSCLSEEYWQVMSGEKDVLFKMKEIWIYLGESFADSEKYIKKITKSNHMREYEAAVRELIANCELV